jgi:cold shock CspA family protein
VVTLFAEDILFVQFQDLQREMMREALRGKKNEMKREQENKKCLKIICLYFKTNK